MNGSHLNCEPEGDGVTRTEEDSLITKHPCPEELVMDLALALTTTVTSSGGCTDDHDIDIEDESGIRG